jgi:hypothetical protein
MSYTPGPWRVTHTDYDTQWIEADCGMSVARIAIVDDGAGCEPGNATLIAAAPEMLAVLEELEESAGYWSEYVVPLGIVDRIREAIKKASGRQ